MSWSIAIALNVVLYAVVTIFTRKVSLRDRKAFFVVGAAMYFSIATLGFVYTLLSTGGLPALPASTTWLLLFTEGVCIPGAWLVQYRIIRDLGAANAVIITGVNALGAACLGLFFLSESLPVMFILGAFLIFASVGLAYHTHPDINTKKIRGSFFSKAWPVVLMIVLYSVGMFTEKVIIDTGGVWSYTTFGWAAQFAGALILLLIFGRHEFKTYHRKTVYRGLLLGALFSLAGVTFVYALGHGALSETTIAGTGRIALTMILAAIFLKERNQLPLRVIAFILSAVGLMLILL